MCMEILFDKDDTECTQYTTAAFAFQLTFVDEISHHHHHHTPTTTSDVPVVVVSESNSSSSTLIVSITNGTTTNVEQPPTPLSQKAKKPEINASKESQQQQQQARQTPGLIYLQKKNATQDSGASTESVANGDEVNYTYTHTKKTFFPA